MERDFMGLAVKQEVSDDAIDAAPLRSSPMQWSFSNKPCSLPQLSPFQSAQEGRKSKTGFDSLSSAGFVTITATTTEAFGTNHKSYSGFMQKDIVSANQSGVGYTATTYPMHHRVTNRMVLPTVPTANPVPTTPSRSPIVGTTDLRSASKTSVAPAQLTMFYNGSVCVYDNISPEKVVQHAQAIMLLAGNGTPMNSSPTISSPPIQASMPRSSILDGFVVSQPYSTTPFRSSPKSISSVSGSRFSGWPSTIGDMNASNQGRIHLSSYEVEPRKVVNASGTVPQFRKKSLARFLEKRKERVIDTSPYANSKSLSINTSGSCQPID